MKKTLTGIITTVFLFFGVSGIANANLIKNGSFEEGNWAGANHSWKTLSPGDTSLTGWIIGGKGIDWHNTAEFQPVLFGGKTVDLNLYNSSNTGTISQSFETEVNQWYRVSFYMTAPGTWFGPAREALVSVAGIDNIFSISSSNSPNLKWEPYSFDFMATAATSTLTFGSYSGGGYWGPVIDNVGVEPVPVPAAFYLFAAGIAGLAGIRRKKRK